MKLVDIFFYLFILFFYMFIFKTYFSTKKLYNWSERDKDTFLVDTLINVQNLTGNKKSLYILTISSIFEKYYNNIIYKFEITDKITIMYQHIIII